MAPRDTGGLDLGTKSRAWLFSRAQGLATLYADRADVYGAGLAFEGNFLFLEVGLEKPLGSPVGMAVGVTGNGLLAADFTFVSHGSIITNL
jgi:hypothetical protein